VNPRRSSERKSPTNIKNAVSREGKPNPKTGATKDEAKIRAAVRDKVSRARTRASQFGSKVQARVTMRAAEAHKVSVRGARASRAMRAANVIKAIKTERAA
jgi:hypothetical protein